MPQNKNLSLEWQTNLGPQWQEVQKKYLHTIGNLTLTAYNSEMSDRPFMDKMDMLIQRFKQHPCKGINSI